jgi:hypothetical protein
LVSDGLDLIKTKGYFRSNLDRPSKIQWSGLLLPFSANKLEEVAGWRNGRWQDSSSWHYGALIFDQILTTKSRRHKGSVLLTCGGEIGSERANDVGAAWAASTVARSSPGSAPVPRTCVEASLSLPLIS